MKRLHIFIISISVSFLIFFSVIFALNGTKSPKLPWQGTPSAFYNARHNVGKNYLADTRFTLVGSGTIVLDAITGLQWQSYYDTGSADYIANFSATGTWDSANVYCSTLNLAGFTGWRVPSITELHSILDFSRNPTVSGVDPAYFKVQKGAGYYYWSSTAYAPVPTSAYRIRFDYYDISNIDKTTYHYIRCVR